MFSRTSKTAGARSLPTATKKGIPSIASVDFKVHGDIDSDGEIQLDGSVQGNVRCPILMIGETGSVQGAVVAEKVHIRGRVVGPVRAKTVELASSAHVIGDIQYEVLTVDTGAFVEGHCKQSDAQVRVEDKITLLPAVSNAS